jgi:hypothetical protein
MGEDGDSAPAPLRIEHRRVVIEVPLPNFIGIENGTAGGSIPTPIPISIAISTECGRGASKEHKCTAALTADGASGNKSRIGRRVIMLDRPPVIS